METLNQIKELLNELNGIDLDMVKQLVDDEIKSHYYDKDKFMLHDEIDNYLYKVCYSDGSHYTYCNGSKAYKEYKNNFDAISVYRISKDLRPTTELLIERV